MLAVINYDWFFLGETKRQIAKYTKLKTYHYPIT